MGPLELADLIGLDTCLAIAEVLHAELGDDKYRPCPLLRQYVAAGWLGRKIGRGFYEYYAGQPKHDRRTKHVRVRSRTGLIAIVTVDREKALNALIAQTLDELGCGAARRSTATRDVRVRHRHRRGRQGVRRRRRHRRDGRAWRRPRRAAFAAAGRHASATSIESMRQAGDRGGQRLRARRRLRARAGVRLHLRQRQGEVRPARGQPRRHPRLRRHAAARAPRRRREAREGAVLHRRHRSTPTRRCASASSTRCSRRPS